MEKGVKNNSTQVISDKDWNNFLKHVVVNKETGIHEWVGAKTKPGVGGYGLFKVNGKLELAHRVAWMRKHGAIPGNLKVLHFNDCPSDVNPDHLFLGSQKLNIMDAATKGRLKGRAVRGKAIAGGELKYILHRLKVGHSCNSISKELGRTVSSIIMIRQRNGISKDGLIQTLKKANDSFEAMQKELQAVFNEVK